MSSCFGWVLFDSSRLFLIFTSQHIDFLFEIAVLLHEVIDRHAALYIYVNPILSPII
jgi:hypothetical protein